VNYLIYFFFLSLSFGQLERISFLDQSVNIYFHDIIILSIIIFYAVKNILTRKVDVREKLDSIEKAGVIFLVILFLSLINGFWRFTFLQNIVGFLYFGRLCMYFIFYFILTHWIHYHNKQSQNAIRMGMILFVVSTVVFSYIQFFLYPNLRNLSYLGWDPHYYRVFGLFFDTSTAGIVYVMLFFWLISQKHSYKSLVVIGSISLFGLILFTYSRSIYITFGIVFTLFFIKRISPLKMLLLVCVFILMVFIMPRPNGYGGELMRTYSITTRMNDYKEGLKLWLRKPLLGYGYNRLRSFTKRPDNISHAGASFSSSYMTILASSGLIGLLVFLYLLYLFFRNAGFNGKLLIFIVAFSSLFDNIFLNNFILTIFLMLMTII